MKKILLFIACSYMSFSAFGSAHMNLPDGKNISTQYIHVREHLDIGPTGNSIKINGISKKILIPGTNGRIEMPGNNSYISTSYIHAKDTISIGYKAKNDGRIYLNGLLQVEGRTILKPGEKKIPLDEKGKISTDYIYIKEKVDIGSKSKNDGQVNVYGNLKVTGTIESALITKLKERIDQQDKIIAGLRRDLQKVLTSLK